MAFVTLGRVAANPCSINYVLFILFILFILRLSYSGSKLQLAHIYFVIEMIGMAQIYKTKALGLAVCIQT